MSDSDAGMTERERRERGLSPSPMRLALLDTIQKDAEEQMQRVADMMRPMITNSALTDSITASMRMAEELAGPITRISEAFASISEPLLKYQEHWSTFITEQKRMDESMTSLAEALKGPDLSITREMFVRPEPVRYVPEYERRPMKVTVELSEKHCEMIGNSVATALIEQGVTVHVHTTSAQIDLTYDRKTRTITRRVGALEYATHFDGKEDNKRRELFEKLARATRGVATDELKEYLDCPSMDATYKVIQGLNKKMADDLGLTMNIADGSDKGGYRINSQIAIHVV